MERKKMWGRFLTGVAQENIEQGDSCQVHIDASDGKIKVKGVNFNNLEQNEEN